MKIRYLWVDYIRAFACILVTMGHLLMSFQGAGIIVDNIFISWLIEITYHFHVYIFFFCTGFLYQKSFSRSYTSQIEKSLNFILLYVLFSGITYVIKFFTSSSVNTPVSYTFIETLINHPINQMWYLYAISVIILCAKRITKDNELLLLLITAGILKAISFSIIWGNGLPHPVKYLCQNFIWFVLGEIFAYKEIQVPKCLYIIVAGLFIVCATIAFVLDIDNAVLSTLFTFGGIIASVGIFYNHALDKEDLSFIWKYISKYMMQIYLLHTICAAGIRIILIKLGIMNFAIHLILGIIFSFIVPVIFAMIAEKSPYLNIVFFPVKTIKKIRNILNIKG